MVCKKKLEDIFGIIYIIDITKFVKIYYYNKVDFLIKVLIKFYKVEIDWERIIVLFFVVFDNICVCFDYG